MILIPAGIDVHCFVNFLICRGFHPHPSSLLDPSPQWQPPLDPRAAPSPQPLRPQRKAATSPSMSLAKTWRSLASQGQPSTSLERHLPMRAECLIWTLACSAPCLLPSVPGCRLSGIKSPSWTSKCTRSALCTVFCQLLILYASASTGTPVGGVCVHLPAHQCFDHHVFIPLHLPAYQCFHHGIVTVLHLPAHPYINDIGVIPFKHSMCIRDLLSRAGDAASCTSDMLHGC